MLLTATQIQTSHYVRSRYILLLTFLASVDGIKQDIRGFPTIKVFPQGGRLPAQQYEHGERTANNFVRWATRSVPNKVKVFSKANDIAGWLAQVGVHKHYDNHPR